MSRPTHIFSQIFSQKPCYCANWLDSSPISNCYLQNLILTNLHLKMRVHCITYSLRHRVRIWHDRYLRLVWPVFKIRNHKWNRSAQNSNSWQKKWKAWIISIIRSIFIMKLSGIIKHYLLVSAFQTYIIYQMHDVIC